MRRSVLVVCLSLVAVAVGQNTFDGQFGQEFEGPFTLPDGSTYRDMLTIEASRAVAKFASSYQPAEKQKVRQNRRIAKAQGGAQESNFVETGSGYSHNWHGHNSVQSSSVPLIYFQDSRRVRLPNDLQNERNQADQDEIDMLVQRDIDDGLTGEPQPSLNPERPRNSFVSFPSSGTAAAPAVAASGNGASFSYSTGGSYSFVSPPGHAAVSLPEEPTILSLNTHASIDPTPEYYNQFDEPSYSVNAVAPVARPVAASAPVDASYSYGTNYGAPYAAAGGHAVNTGLPSSSYASISHGSPDASRVNFGFSVNHG